MYYIHYIRYWIHFLRCTVGPCSSVLCTALCVYSPALLMHCSPLSLLPLVITGLSPRPTSLFPFSVQVHWYCCCGLTWVASYLSLSDFTHVMLSWFIHVAANGLVSLSLWTSSVYCMCAPHVLSFHQWVGAGVASVSEVKCYWCHAWAPGAEPRSVSVALASPSSLATSALAAGLIKFCVLGAAGLLALPEWALNPLSHSVR